MAGQLFEEPCGAIEVLVHRRAPSRGQTHESSISAPSSAGRSIRPDHACGPCGERRQRCVATFTIRHHQRDADRTKCSRLIFFSCRQFVTSVSQFAGHPPESSGARGREHGHSSGEAASSQGTLKEQPHSDAYEHQARYRGGNRDTKQDKLLPPQGLDLFLRPPRRSLLPVLQRTHKQRRRLIGWWHGYSVWGFSPTRRRRVVRIL